MRRLTIVLLTAAILIAYPAITLLELGGGSDRYRSTVWAIIVAIEAPLVIMLALQLLGDSRRIVVATAIIAFIAAVCLMPFLGLMILGSVMDFMGDGVRWGLLGALTLLLLAIGIVSRRRARQQTG